ncbi:MAG: DNA-directed RNA polymerase subunit N [Nanoarchaeota archaeon]|jgi:DNA-directed RNA polymerase subunit N (RpoN/RPB10)
MIIPVRCFSCGKVIGSKWEKYQKLLQEGKKPKEALDELQLERFCCRGAIISHVESIDIIGSYM